MRAANRLAEQRKQDDWHIVLFGNQPGEERKFEAMLSSAARQHVIFGGYRHDLNLIQRGCYAAIIASTGWDSFPRSGMEMQASGLPLLASALPGLSESVEPGYSGFLFTPDSDGELSDLMSQLLDDGDGRNKLSFQARKRIEERFSLQAQFEGLISTMRKVAAR
jgi:glycosyltransferase involved in cell wall biosynthesis